MTLHVAAAPETTRLVNREFLDAMPAGAILINHFAGRSH